MSETREDQWSDLLGDFAREVREETDETTAYPARERLAKRLAELESLLGEENARLNRLVDVLAAEVTP